MLPIQSTLPRLALPLKKTSHLIQENQTTKFADKVNSASLPAKDAGVTSLASKRSSSERRWTRDEIARDILAGHLLLVYADRVYKVNSWISNHPGGEQLLLHFIGREATDQINVSHSKQILATKFKPFCVGSLTDSERGQYRSLLPPSMLGFHPVPGTLGKNKLVQWFQEGETRAFLEGRERRKEKHDPFSEKSDTPATNPVDLQLADLYPLISQPFTANEAAASSHFKQLCATIDDAGLMEHPGRLSGYASDIFRYVALAACSIGCWWMVTGGTWTGWGAYAGTWASAVALGLYWHVVALLCHDIGHRSLANGSWWANNVLGVLIAGGTGGLSIGWWCHEHNIHHHMTNDVEHDPDVQQLPFLALNEASLDSLWSTRYKEYKHFDAFAKIAVKFQHLTYYFLLSVGRFNLCILSYQHLIVYAKRDAMWLFEMASLSGFFYWFGAVVLAGLPSWKLRAIFLLVSFMTSSPLHLMIVQSHYSRSMEDMGVMESHSQHNLRTTMDITVHPSLQPAFGGLHHQVTHHLFPRMPRHNLEAATVLVKEWADSHGYIFDSYGFVEGNQMTLSVLKSIADQVRFMGVVAADSVQEMSQKGVAQAFTP